MLAALTLTLATQFTVTEQDSMQQRSNAARTLAQAISEASMDAPPFFWIASARATIDALGPGAFSATLEESISDARWRAFDDPALASKLLEQELRMALVDLEFVPVSEAKLPQGFPPPTPVREIEIKRYPRYRMVNADVQGRGSSGAFWVLFGHIKQNRLAMTAPVEMTYSREEGDLTGTKMSFIYGSPDLGELGPVGRVEVLDAEPGWFLSIGCRGEASKASIEAARARLIAWVDDEEGIETTGDLRSMGYNSPMVRDSKQYFEVQIPVIANAASERPRLVLDLGEPNASRRWSSVNDSVMGGRSVSRLTPSGEGTCHFEGRVSLENNGGFASVRTRPADLELGGARSLRLKFRGDGKTYKLRLRTTDGFNAVNYEVSFTTTTGLWEERDFPIDNFIPVWRGRRVRGASKLDPGQVRSVGFLISDKQAGPFRLEVKALSKV
jgi:NADH dehydrogenase [ubiquinone] 1 alpha subcomplex assembly factor 1